LNFSAISEIFSRHLHRREFARKALVIEPRLELPCWRFSEETTMAWTTPTLIEICIGLEINGYLPAEF